MGLAFNPPSDEALKESLLQDAAGFPLYHVADGELLPRVSGVLRLYYESLHQVMHFGEPNKYFVEEVNRRCDEGHRIHDAISIYITRGMYDGKIAFNGFTPVRPDEMKVDDVLETDEDREKFDRFVAWERTKRPTFLRMPEDTLSSRELGFAGTPDIFCRVDGKKVLIDVKTGDEIHEANWIQISAYKTLLETIEGHRIDLKAILLLDAHKKQSKLVTQGIHDTRMDTFNKLLRRWNDMFPEPFQPWLLDEDAASRKSDPDISILDTSFA